MHRLAPLFMGYTDHCGHQHSRMAVECRLDLVGIDIESATDDHVFLTVDNVEETMLIDATHITRLPETVLELSGCLLGAAEIAQDNGPGAQPDLTGFAARHSCAIIVHDLHLHTRHWSACGSEM